MSQHAFAKFSEYSTKVDFSINWAIFGIHRVNNKRKWRGLGGKKHQHNDLEEKNYVEVTASGGFGETTGGLSTGTVGETFNSSFSFVAGLNIGTSFSMYKHNFF